MTNKKDVGVYQKKNGFWEYRFVMVVNGEQISKKKSTDEFGNKLKTKREAVKARNAAMAAARIETQRKIPIKRKTVSEVFEEYRKAGRTDKAYDNQKTRFIVGKSLA